jgi:sn-glycerol 3-phosphate transport system substrate-binding protein
MPKFKFVIFVVVGLSLLFASCGDGTSVFDRRATRDAARLIQETAGDANGGSVFDQRATRDAARHAQSSSGRTRIVFWHAMADELGDLVDQLVDRYNRSQDQVEVTAIYKGDYDAVYQIILEALSVDTAPNVTQFFDIGTQKLLDTRATIPVYRRVDAGGDFGGSNFVVPVREYYSDENGLLAMPFNSSAPLVYYNADMFAAAGLEPPDPDWDFSTFLATCDQLLEAGAAPVCFSFSQNGWFFEQLLANSGGLYFNNNNGHTGRPTEVKFNELPGVEVFTFLTGAIEDGYAFSGPNQEEQAEDAFTGGRVAMTFDSSADVARLEARSDFEVGTAYLPHRDSSERNGVNIGGAALWLIDSGNEVENEAALDFMKFMAAREQQIDWHKGSGYIPVRVELYEDPDLRAFWDENPNFGTAILQLYHTKDTLDDGSPNYAVHGSRAGAFADIRQLIIEAYGRVIDDGLSPRNALNETARKADSLLTNYNAFFTRSP